MDPWSVIYLGHTLKQPLIEAPSELSYRLEPHGHIYTSVRQSRPLSQRAWWEGVYPGWCWLGGYMEGAIPGTQPGQIEGLFKEYTRFIGSYGRLTGFYLKYGINLGPGSGSWIWVLDLTLDLVLDLTLDLSPTGPKTGL